MKRSSDLKRLEPHRTIGARLEPACRMCLLFLASLILMVLSLGLPGGLGADDSQIYYWKDAKGILHFSNIQPEKPVQNLERMREIPYDPEKDRKRMQEDEAWQLEVRERAEQARRKMAEEQAAKAAEEARVEARRRQALEEARARAEAQQEQAVDRRSDLDDKSVFVNPSSDILGIHSRSKPRPKP